MMPEVGCAGILVEDTFCGPMRELPTEGSLLALDTMPVRAGGCAANVAIDLAKQGVSVDALGCLGNDASANVLVSCFEQNRVGCDRLTYTKHFPTSKTVILLIEGQDRRYLHVFGANQAFGIADIDRGWLSSLKAFYLGGLFAMPAIRIDELADLLKFCRRQRIMTVVDVVVPHDFVGMQGLDSLLPHIDWFLPNRDEAQRFTGLASPRDQLAAFQRAGANGVVITCGEQGAIAGCGKQVWECGIYDARAIDPSGSGDAFTAGVIAGSVRGWSVPQTLRYASALGSSATRAVGTTDGVFTAAEAAAFISRTAFEVREIA